jgi:hypothetical protein
MFLKTRGNLGRRYRRHFRDVLPFEDAEGPVGF